MPNNPPKNNTPDKALVERARQICADVRPDYASGFLSGEYDQSSTEMRVAIAALSQPQHGGLVEQCAQIAERWDAPPRDSAERQAAREIASGIRTSLSNSPVISDATKRMEKTLGAKFTVDASKPRPVNSPVVGEDAPATPAGMKPWHGGESEPDDWDGGDVQLRDGAVGSASCNFTGADWTHSGDDNDIIAYTPTDTAEEGIDDRGNRYRFASVDTADRIGYVNADPTPEDVAADRREALRRMSDAARDLNVASALDLLATYADDETLASLIAVPDGMCIVPREPTEAMLTEAVDNVGPIGCCNHTPDTARETWSAMIAARPNGEQEPDRIGFYSAGDGE